MVRTADYNWDGIPVDHNAGTNPYERDKESAAKGFDEIGSAAMRLSPSRRWHNIFGACILPGGLQFSPYRQFFIAEGSEPATTFSIDDGGTLPHGLQFETVSIDEEMRSMLLADGHEERIVDSQRVCGLLTGQPRRAGTYSFSIEAKNQGGRSAKEAYSLTVLLNLDSYRSYFDQPEPLRRRVDDQGEISAPAICYFDEHDDGADFDRRDLPKQFPLSLCEFLGYKSVQAYKTESQLLKELGPDATKSGHRPGVSHFKFFDSAATTASTVPPELLRDFAELVDPHAPGMEKLSVQLAGAMRLADTQAFGFLFEKKAFLIMRGTETYRDMRVDIDSGLTGEGSKKRSWSEALKFWERRTKDLAPAERFLLGDLYPARHIGFARAFGAIRHQIEAWIDSLPDKDNSDFVFSGHSLGGALAFIGAYEFAQQGRNVFAVVTFGAPAVGKTTDMRNDEGSSGPRPGAPLQFVDAYRQINAGRLWSRTLRLQTGADAVPAVLENLGYSHVGREWPVQLRPLPGSVEILRRRYVTKPLWSFALFVLSFYGVKQLASSLNAQSKTTRSDASKKGPKKSHLSLKAIRRAVEADAISYAMILGSYAATAYAAHSAQSRYALYLSALTYRKLRAKRSGNFTSGDARDYQLVREEVESYLRMLRGPSHRARKFFVSKPVWTLPRLVKGPKHEAKLARRFYSDKKGEYLF